MPPTHAAWPIPPWPIPPWPMPPMPPHTTHPAHAAFATHAALVEVLPGILTRLVAAAAELLGTRALL